MHFLFFLLGLAAGIVIEVYCFPIVRIFGRMEWAERIFGPGGTYSAWRIIGIACIFGGFIALRV